MSIPVTIHGRLTRAPELRFTPSGQAVASFSITENDRYRDQQTGEWKDSEPGYWDCQAWKQLAEQVCEDFDKGQLVLATGKLKQRRYEDKDGNKRIAYEVTIDAIGPSLRGVQQRSAEPAQERYADDDNLKPPF